ncbi:MaoC/PaaZ C-terminal domain-containing protein [Nocardia sp. NPDC046763]|uniref:MaoC/PaaZ C-terminal domain-containing protein n=1 Tax=Nocardia sp. NPDC046763 TaxID=3155256 RepID=UPI0033D61778
MNFQRMPTIPLMAFAGGAVGVWSDAAVFTVTREHLAAYAAATNDPIPAHRAGDIASPMFAAVPGFELMKTATISVSPPAALAGMVQGAQDFRFHRPIRPGDVLRTRGMLAGYTGFGTGTRALARVECRDDAGELVNEQYATFVFPGFDAGDQVGERAPLHRFDPTLRRRPPEVVVPQRVDADQPARYAPVSGDPLRIHLDEEIARAAGLPGIIAHGMCTLAFTSWAVLTRVGDSDVHRIRRFAGRFWKPVLPGDGLETRIWRKEGSDALARYAFETARGDDFVITDGLVELAV